jgi:hypothetical protein
MLDELHLCAFATAWLQMSPEFIALSHTPKLPHWNTNTGSGVPSKQSTTQRIQDPCISLPKQFITGPFLSGSLIHSKYLSVQLLTQFNTDPFLSGSLLHSNTSTFNCWHSSIQILYWVAHYYTLNTSTFNCWHSSLQILSWVAHYSTLNTSTFNCWHSPWKALSWILTAPRTSPEVLGTDAPVHTKQQMRCHWFQRWARSLMRFSTAIL